MLAKLENDLFHLLNVLESIGKINTYTDGINDAEEFLMVNDQMNFNASLNLLINIGESISKLSDLSKSGINKFDIIGLRGARNRIVHDYPGLDSFQIWDIINENLESLKIQVISVVNKHTKSNEFDVEELEVSAGSVFYSHIDFSVFELLS